MTDSLLRCAGALQLLPNNATKWLRFARMVEATRAARPARPQRTATLDELEALLTGPPIANNGVLSDEDPFEGPFTAPVVFEGAEYLTIPGAVAHAATVCQFLLTALDELSDKHADAREAMRRDAARLLWIADTVTRRSGLERWQEPTFEKDRGVHIPAQADLRRLEAAVCLDDSDVEQRFGGIEGFSDLCWPNKRLPWSRDRTRLTDDRAVVYPLSQSASSNALIVPSPNQLALSVVHRVAAHAVVHGVHRELMAEFERAVLAEAIHLCKGMRWEPLDSSLTLETSDTIRDALFAFDVDKVAHVVVFADDLDGYRVARPHATTDSTAQMQRVSERMKRVREAVGAVEPGGEVLHLILMVPIGRPMHAEFTERDGDGWSVLMLAIDELRTIADHERDDSLGLWRFATALKRLPLPLYGVVSNVADAYALHLECARRPHRLGGRDARPVWLPPGFGGPLVVNHRRRSDLHSTELPDGSEVVLVSREGVSDTVCVYVPQREDLRHVKIVELALPCWVRAHGNDARSREICAAVADALTHHLWLMRDAIDPYLSSIAQSASRVVVDIAGADASLLSLTDLDDAADTPWFKIAVDRDAHCITVLLQPNAAVRLSQVADRAEGILVAEVVRTLASLAGQRSDVADTDLADVASHELPRFIYVGTGYVPGVHGGGTLSGCRLKHHVELDAVENEIAAIASGLGLDVGPVSREHRADVIAKIVCSLNGMLIERLRELDPEATFEYLVSEQERMQRDRTVLRLMAPTTFAEDAASEHSRKAVALFHKINQSALASRYLIESAVQHVRGGHLSLSLSRYDELLAISHHMIGLGFLGDACRYGLSDLTMHFLEPGWLAIDPGDSFQETVGNHTDASARSLVDKDLLAEWTDFITSQELATMPDPSEELVVFEVEYGVPLIGFLQAVGRLGELAAREDDHVMTMPVSDLLQDFVTTTELTDPQAAKMLDMMSLRANPDAVDPDVFDPDFTPWRYARENSFVRRPVLIRGRGKAEVATWGAQTPWTATEALFEQIYTGRLVARSRQMKRYINQQRNRISREFETEVADIYRRDPHNRVSEQVKSLGNTSLKRDNGDKLGDIDVLVTNKRRKTLLIIEAKSFAATRSVREIKTEVDKLVSGKNSAVTRHNERVRFVQDHWSTLHRQMRLPGSACDWRINGLVVTTAPSIAADLLRRLGSDVGTTIISVEDLRQTQTRINDRVSA